VGGGMWHAEFKKMKGSEYAALGNFLKNSNK